MLVAISLSVISAEAQEQPGAASHIVSEAGASMFALSNALAQADWAARDEAEGRLVALGKDAIPLLLERAKTDEGTPAFRQDRVRAIAKSDGGGEASTRALIDLTLTARDTNVALAAGGWLSNRRINFPLTQEQVTGLVSRIGGDNLSAAAGVARALARATNVDKRVIAAPVVELLARAIRENRGRTNSPTRGSYVSSEVLHLDGFLTPFSDIGFDAVGPYLREKLGAARAAGDARMSFWLTIAIGHSGDRSVAESLLKVVQSTNEDSSLRAAALAAYASALKQDAIPILEQYTSDSTSGPDPRHPPIAMIAKRELAFLLRANPKR